MGPRVAFSTIVLLLKAWEACGNCGAIVSQPIQAYTVTALPCQPVCQTVQSQPACQSVSSLSITPTITPIAQFIIPAVIKPLIQPDPEVSQPAPTVPAPSNDPGFPGVYPSPGDSGFGFPGYGGGMPPIIIKDDKDDVWRQLMYFLIFALGNKLGGCNGGGCSGGCGGRSGGFNGFGGGNNGFGGFNGNGDCGCGGDMSNIILNYLSRAAANGGPTPINGEYGSGNGGFGGVGGNGGYGGGNSGFGGVGGNGGYGGGNCGFNGFGGGNNGFGGFNGNGDCGCCGDMSNIILNYLSHAAANGGPTPINGEYGSGNGGFGGVGGNGGYGGGNSGFGGFGGGSNGFGGFNGNGDCGVYGVLNDIILNCFSRASSNGGPIHIPYPIPVPVPQYQIPGGIGSAGSTGSMDRNNSSGSSDDASEGCTCSCCEGSGDINLIIRTEPCIAK